MLQGILIDFQGNEYALPALLSWDMSYGSGQPCDAFQISFVYSPDMLTALEDAVEFRAEYAGETVFAGVIDEFEISALEAGGAVTLWGRGMAALLLDNEAEAAELYGAGLELILSKYVTPWGITKLRKNVSPPAQSLVVASGSSCWRVLEDYLWFGCGERPRFSRDGTLILGEEEGNRFVVDSSTGVLEESLRIKRYGVISQVLVKNKAIGVSSVVDNSEFLQRGGRCTRVINVPRYTRYDSMRSTGNYQIEQSKADQLRFSLTLAEMFAAFPGDTVLVENSVSGLVGEFVVGESRCFASPDGAGTRLVLTKKADKA